MTDRELLKFAAKAAGIEAIRDPNGVWRNCTGFDPAMNVFAGVPWNPITDDGDALRLAVKLGLDVQMHGCNSMHPYAFAFDDARNIGEEEQPSDGDPYAATRRAIVRAAAAIGKEMP